MQFPDSFFEDEVRNGFYVPALIKRNWAAQLEVLTEVAKVCVKYNIRWFAYYGTLLGAVRHGGFIPWDDDIDICMLREDYIRFNLIAEKELPEGYYIPRDRGDNYRLLTTVLSGTPLCLEEEHLKKFHNFPFSPGIDIFPLDYVAPNPEDEEFQNHLITIVWHAAITIDKDNQRTDESEAMVAKVEELLNVRLDREQSLKEQLFALLENIFALYTAEESKELTLMSEKHFDSSHRFPIEYFQNTVYLPFETFTLPIPASYDKILKILYGDYRKPVRNGGANEHNYPYFLPMQKELEKHSGAAFLLGKYPFSAEDLKKNRTEGTGPQKTAEDFVRIIGDTHKAIFQNLGEHQIATVKKLLEACQDTAICMGNLIEQIEGESGTVKLLEKYCEYLYQIHQELATDSTSVPGHVQALTCHQLDEMYCSIKTSIMEGISRRKEIVFFPYKASLWGPMESVWKKAVQNPDYQVYVIPIPYCYKDSHGAAAQIQFEGDQFPDYVPVTDFRSYDFQNRQPDMMFIQNPYDNYNLTTSVHSSFYACNLKQYTDHLVYLPCFPLDEISRDDAKSWYNMQYYVAMPGVIQADLIAVPSAQMRQLYIDYLTEFAGENTRTIWEKKIMVLDDLIL